MMLPFLSTNGATLYSMFCMLAFVSSLYLSASMHEHRNSPRVVRARMAGVAVTSLFSAYLLMYLIDASFWVRSAFAVVEIARDCR